MSDAATASVLALNAGSSSLKFGLFAVDADACRRVLSGTAAFEGTWVVRDDGGQDIGGDSAPGNEAGGAVAAIKRVLESRGLPKPDAIGHRIVHGGRGHRDHVVIDESVIRQLQDAIVLAPLHAPASIELLQATGANFPHVPQVACLDTAFHRTMPDVARTLPIPASLRDRGVERYGFHGLSCESIVRQLGAPLPPRLVIAHLGHGASVTAVADGRSIDTSMGLTPSGGVMMSTRTGDIDPGLLLYAARELDGDLSALETLLDRQSGLLGVSGSSDDMRELHSAAASSADARLAIAMFCYSVRKQVGAMAAVLGGLDLLVFTGGIGENDPLVRADICAGLDALGLASGDAPSRISVLPSQEDAQIARHAWDLVFATGDATRVACPSLSD
ncbi:acetate/propionate family kinase [Cognatiluteimonas profundi]|uniref:acetate/propionate family kinase n=1 Tax=Cognatiluteimonas profundi TaxID=2594501 RepID=UPI00131E2765|nr:acetate/propionate family kinase [Lysobacter profundi]